MTNWSRLPVVDSQTYFSRKLDERVSEYQSKCEQLNQARRSLEKDRELLQQNLTTGQKTEPLALIELQNRFLEAFREEIKIREEFIELVQLIRPMRMKARDKALEKLNQKKDEIRGKLLNIGYFNTASENGGFSHGIIQEFWILTHPEVFSCQMELNELNQDSFSEHLQNNKSMIASANESVRRYVNKMTQL